MAESKNASVVRKIFGYQHIPQKWAPEITLEALDEYALQMSANEAANCLQKARQQLFSLIFKQDKTG